MSDSRLLDSLKKLKRLIRIGIELSAQRDHETLMEEILLGAKDLTNADGGTLYTVTPDHTLRFNILRTDSLRLHLGGSSGNVVSLPEIPLFDVNGKENLRTVVTYSVHRRSPVNIDDVYKVLGFDFSGTRDFDARTGYR
ncbi:MAG: diguanylate cyclase, partial [Chlamydiia bacterium]|nr:diguanylate cyclase [Chlamydiia bacterium]